MNPLLRLPLAGLGSVAIVIAAADRALVQLVVGMLALAAAAILIRIAHRG